MVAHANYICHTPNESCILNVGKHTPDEVCKLLPYRPVDTECGGVYVKDPFLERKSSRPNGPLETILCFPEAVVSREMGDRRTVQDSE